MHFTAKTFGDGARIEKGGREDFLQSKMIDKLKTELARNIVNCRGRKVNKQIVVIESDDWGSIRMPSKDVFAALKKQQIPVDKCDYCQNDSLASEDYLALD